MHPDVAVLKFLDVADADLDAGGLRDVETYVRHFPDHADRIRAEFGRLLDRSSDDASAAPPRSIGGRYRVIESLGRGGFGEVFLAEDSQLARRVAIKVLAGLRALSDEWCARLVREAEATNRIADQGLCPVYDVGFEDGVPFLVMPWIPGRSLDRLLAASAARGEAPIQLGDTSSMRQRRDAFLRLVELVARTLHTAHEAGVVHRDVKPANILVRPDGRPVLIDFGLAWLESAEDAYTRSGALGTPAYSAPEVLRGGRIAPDPRLDVWSLGAVLFEGLALRRPFTARPGVSLERSVLDEPPPRLDRVLGRDLQAVIETALARRPAERYATMAAFADDLARLQRGEPVRVRAAGSLRRIAAWTRARPRAVGFGAAALALLTTVVVTLASQWARARERAVVVEVAGVLAGQLEQTIRENEQLSRFGFAIEGRSQRAAQLLATVRGLRRGVGSDAEIDRCLARVLLAAGGLHLQLGDGRTGTEHNEEALRVLNGIEQRGLATDDDRAAIAHAMVLLGDARSHVADVAGALELFRAAQAIDVALMEARPDDATRVSNVGFGHMRLGHMLGRSGNPSARRDEERQATALLRRAEALDPDSIERRGHTAEALLNEMQSLVQTGAPKDDIMMLLGQTDRRLQEQVEAFPRSSIAWQRLVSGTKLRLHLTEDREQRLGLADRVFEYATRVAELEPGAPYHLNVLNTAVRQRAVALTAVGRCEEAVAAIDAVLANSARLLQSSPDVWSFANERISALANARDIYVAAGRSDRIDELNSDLAALLTAQLERPVQVAATWLQLAKLLIDPSLGERADPRRVLDLLEARRTAGTELGPELVDLERLAKSRLR